MFEDIKTSLSIFPILVGKTSSEESNTKNAIYKPLLFSLEHDREFLGELLIHWTLFSKITMDASFYTNSKRNRLSVSLHVKRQVLSFEH